MQRCGGKYRVSAISAIRNLAFSSSHRSLHSSPNIRAPVSFPVNRSISNHIFHLPSRTDHQLLFLGFRPSLSPFTNQTRDFASKKKERKRTPITPVTSKLKKTKIKSYSSFKFRFRTMNDGQVRRWRAGKRHNAHLKSKKSIRRLRKPEIVHPAYAKVMKKLNFCG
ncbi:uncharacterized protein LOC131247964 [Magnolia sinica]|uniref:uncharacterized protein LOC131247964 n=1 Tax=Magnolia sinica TaxID=86752 RepID=UPI00265A986B|nr:uncharacterized protein LOC131247964 [Magnolia sinica]